MDWIFFDVMSPKHNGIMKSISPWHCRMGRYLWPLNACRTGRPFSANQKWKTIHIHQNLRTVGEKNTTIAQQKCICTDGKVLWSGSQQLRATTPANLCWQVKAVYKDKAPPWKEWIQKKEGLSFEVVQLQCYNAEIKGPTWEKPPRIIRWGGIPFLASCSIKAFTRGKQ